MKIYIRNGKMVSRNGKFLGRPNIQNTVPAAFSNSQWTLADSISAQGDSLTLTILQLPNNGGTPITDIEYRVNSGSWTSLSTTATGVYFITGLTVDVSTNVEIRAVNSVGGGNASDTKSATPTASGDTGAALLTGGTRQVTLDLSQLSPAGETTHIDWAVSPQGAPATESTWPAKPATYSGGSLYVGGFNTRVPVANIGTPITVDFIPLPGPYVAYTREVVNGVPGSWSSASSPATVTAPSGVTSKTWYSEVASLIGPTALGNTVGRTSVSALTVIDPLTMTQGEIEAALPSGWSFVDSGTSKELIPTTGTSGSPRVLENYTLRNCRILVNSGVDYIEIRNCNLYHSRYSSGTLQGNGLIRIEGGGRVRVVKNCNIFGNRISEIAGIGQSGQSVVCVANNSSPTVYGIVDEISYNFITGTKDDCASIMGASTSRGGADPEGCWVHHNVLDAQGYVDGDSVWGTGEGPHADLLTVKGSVGNGVRIEKNVLWQIPIEPCSVPSSLDPNGIQRYAGAARQYAGGRGNILSTSGLGGQNNAFRIVPDNNQLSSLYEGPIRITQNLHVKWMGMQGSSYDTNTTSEALGDIAVWDNIFGNKDGNGNYGRTNLENLLSTAAGGMYISLVYPDYSAEYVQFWTGVGWLDRGTPGDLATPL